jgi:hypothetical protein
MEEDKDAERTDGRTEERTERRTDGRKDENLPKHDTVEADPQGPSVGLESV